MSKYKLCITKYIQNPNYERDLRQKESLPDEDKWRQSAEEYKEAGKYDLVLTEDQFKKVQKLLVSLL